MAAGVLGGSVLHLKVSAEMPAGRRQPTRISWVYRPGHLDTIRSPQGRTPLRVFSCFLRALRRQALQCFATARHPAHRTLSSSSSPKGHRGFTATVPGGRLRMPHHRERALPCAPGIEGVHVCAATSQQGSPPRGGYPGATTSVLCVLFSLLLNILRMWNPPWLLPVVVGPCAQRLCLAFRGGPRSLPEFDLLSTYEVGY